MFPAPAALRAKAAAIKVEALGFPHPPASYFVEAARLERQADVIEAATCKR